MEISKEIFATAALGIEFGSTKIKAVLLSKDNVVLGTSSYSWENKFENNVWTYDKSEIILGLQTCYANLKKEIQKKYNHTITNLGSIGISAMMHGYIALDKNDNLLVPFRTWRNTTTEKASTILTNLFSFHIPQRWTIAHYFQAILNSEPHIPNISFLSTLAVYIHYLLTGEKKAGIGEASGIFPINSSTHDYDLSLVEKFKSLTNINILDLLPQVQVAGQVAGKLTSKGAILLDIEGDLKPNIPFCPPEGDAGTGMVATNSIKVGTGNVSAGTSIFSMLVLEKALKKPYNEIDIVTTPVGDNVAMVHCNNCSTDINNWIKIFIEYNDLIGTKVDRDLLYEKLFEIALQGDADSGGVTSINYYSGEHITNFNQGIPLLIHDANSNFNLANLMRSLISTAFATLKFGFNILKNEDVKVDSIIGHGGVFKVEKVGQLLLSSALAVPVTTMEHADVGGAWGMAVLANFLNVKDYTLDEYLDKVVFTNTTKTVVSAKKKDIIGFTKYYKRFVKSLKVEKAAIKSLGE
jgi:sugar (pentulose or hexulose) kinase